MMNIAILQARMSSSRLPGKVLKPLANLPMLVQQSKRILQSSQIDKLIIATSVNPEDDEIVIACKKFNLECFRGDLNNVLSRFVILAQQHDAKNIIRLTADCPLTDHNIIDLAIKTHIEGGYDYTSNCHPRTFPDGLDVEILSYDTLMLVNDKSKSKLELEHVTTYIDEHLDEFKIGNVEQEHDLSALRWTVDLEEDYLFVCKVYDALYENNNSFNQKDILDFCGEKSL